jgi:hypothetical protein
MDGFTVLPLFANMKRSEVPGPHYPNTLALGGALRLARAGELLHVPASWVLFF